jgi:hypothetical protein
MDFICNNIIKSELAVSKDKISDTPGVPPEAIDIFTKMASAKYAFNMMNDKLTKAKQNLIDIYSYNSLPTNIREELLPIRAYDKYCLAALNTWREGNNYILYQSNYISILFNMTRKARELLVAAINKEYWLETLVENDIDIRASLKIAIDEAYVAEIEAIRYLCIAIDEPDMNKPLNELYNTIINNHLSLAKVIAELSIAPLCIEFLDNSLDFNIIKDNIHNNIFTSISPNMECINTFYNTIQAANKTLECHPSDIKVLDEANKAFEDAKNNVIGELTNMYMYKFNEFINT